MVPVSGAAGDQNVMEPKFKWEERVPGKWYGVWFERKTNEWGINVYRPPSQVISAILERWDPNGYDGIAIEIETGEIVATAGDWFRLLGLYMVYRQEQNDRRTTG